MRAFKLVSGFALLAIGPFWSVQGAVLVRLKPILCVAHCVPVAGGSVAWLFAGFVAFAVGLGLLATLKRWSR